MHTASTRRFLRPLPASPGVGLATMRALLVLVGLLCVTAPGAAAQSFPGASQERMVNYRVYPTEFWGPRVGPGVGLGMVVHNLARPHDHWLLTAAPARHEQAATFSFASANPRTARRSILVDARGLHTNRDWYGAPDRRVTLERRSYRARVRVGHTALGRRLLVQPHVSLDGHRVDDRTGPESGSPNGVGGVSPPPSRSFQGARAGLNVRVLTPSNAGRATSAVRLRVGWERYVSLDGADLRFDRIDASVKGVWAIHDVHRLVGRVGITTTEPRTSVPVPIVFLPILDGTVAPGWARGRFVDRDRLLGQLLYRFPLWSLGEVVALEGHAGGHLAGIYRDVSDQFTTAIQFDAPDPTDPERPLRPSISLGLRLSAPIRPHASMDLAVGLSPEGFSAATFSFRQSLQALRAPHHTTDVLP